jgi:hypothetical protein
VYILRNEIPVWGGIIWKRTYSSTDNSVRFECSTFESYFSHRFLSDVISFESGDGEDQLVIAQTIARQVASEALIDVATGKTGVLRYWTGFYYEFKKIDAAITSISSLFDGFDWNVRVYVDGSTHQLKRRLIWGYPYLGVLQKNTQLAFMYPGNIKTYTTLDDADGSGTNIYTIGGGEGLDQIISASSSPKLINAGWPILDYSVSYKDTFNPALLDAKAVLDAAKFRSPVTILTVTVAAGSEPELGSYNPGDWARFHIEDEWNSEPIDTYFRITEISTTVSDTGAPEAVTLVIGGVGTEA